VAPDALVALRLGGALPGPVELPGPDERPVTAAEIRRRVRSRRLRQARAAGRRLATIRGRKGGAPEGRQRSPAAEGGQAMFPAIGYNESRGGYLAMRVTEVIWKQRFAEKLLDKHGVAIEEAEEALRDCRVLRKVGRGKVKGQDVYAGLAQIESGRYLIVIFIAKRGGAALPISARDMDSSERKYYAKHRPTA